MQTADSYLPLAKGTPKLLKITVTAVNARSILGYGKKNLTYKMRFPREETVNPIEKAIIEIVQSSPVETFLSFSFSFFKEHCWLLYLLGAIFAVVIVLLIFFCYFCCGRRTKNKHCDVENSVIDNETDRCTTS